MYLVEYMTIWVWLVHIAPKILVNKLNKLSGYPSYHFIECSLAFKLLSPILRYCTGTSIDQLKFNLANIRDTKDQSIQLKLTYSEASQMQDLVTRTPEFQKMCDSLPDEPGLIFFLKKNVIPTSLNSRSLWRALILVHICLWKSSREGVSNQSIHLIIQKRPWIESLVLYAEKQHITTTITAYTPKFNLKHFVKSAIPLSLRIIIQKSLHNLTTIDLKHMQIRLFVLGLWTRHKKSKLSQTNDQPPLVAVEYLGQLNIENPAYQSDLFFWQQSSLKGENMLLTFNQPSSPLKQSDLNVLKNHQISALALSPKATTAKKAIIHWPSIFSSPAGGNVMSSIPTDNWSKRQIKSYKALYDSWLNIFSKYPIKVHISWYKYDSSHCAIGDALRAVGGISAIYQRAFESQPSTETAMFTDLSFAYSSDISEIDKRSGSHIKYHIAVGYIGDHRFDLLKEESNRVRKSLKNNGAKHILSYSDENTHADPRWWFMNHEQTREQYEYLLKKVLSESWLGLIIKPKVPGTLHQRLGDISQLLTEAEETGRCHVYYGNQGLHSSYPPAVAALASDISIHGHLHAGTAGLESALAGVPTLLLDQEGCPDSSLYKLEKGSVIFDTYDDLWNACTRHWSDPQKQTGIGDWSNILDELDPFRDGRAAERIGEYIKWILDGYKDGLDRKTIMDLAAEKYCTQWGYDKVTQVNA